MEWAALVTWLLTAAGGFVLLLIWVSRGGMSQSEPGNRIRPPTMFAIWLKRRRGQAAQPVEASALAEQHFRVAVVALHGVLAVTTVLLVFLAAVGVGS